MLLLNRDELADMLLFLARLHILKVAFATRKLRAAVDALPPNRCLLLLNDVVLKKEWDFREHEPRSLSERVRRTLQRFVEDVVQPYELRISPSSEELKPLMRRSRSFSKLMPVLFGAIRNSNVHRLHINLSRTPRKLERTIRQSASTSGRIQEIVVHVDCRRVPPSLFEALPLLAAEVETLHFSYATHPKSRPTPAHQTEKLLRNCIDRGVCSLKLLQKEVLGIHGFPVEESSDINVPTEGSSDINEEMILEFCFAPRNVRPDRPAQIELWLNWIDLPPQFLSRFIQASESCDSDHKVKLLLRGANVCQQDMSQFHIHDPNNWFGASTWVNEGEYAVRVVRNLEVGFFFAHRSTLSFDEWCYDNERLFPVELDAWLSSDIRSVVMA